jgi:hypothetical protein
VVGGPETELVLEKVGVDVTVGVEEGGGPTQKENERSDWNSAVLDSIMADSSAELSPAKMVIDPSPKRQQKPSSPESIALKMTSDS